MLYLRIHLHLETRARSQIHAQIKFLWSWSPVWSTDAQVYPSLPGSGMLSAADAVLHLRRLSAGWRRSLGQAAVRQEVPKTISFLTLGERAEQNCLKAKKNAFPPSKTVVCSALPVPYRGVTYTTSTIAPAYGSSVLFCKVASLPFVPATKSQPW